MSIKMMNPESCVKATLNNVIDEAPVRAPVILNTVPYRRVGSLSMAFIGFGLTGVPSIVVALEGGVVVSGQAVINGMSTPGVPHITTIHQTTPQALIDWQDFSIAKGDEAHFNVPSSGSMTINRVVSNTFSDIQGKLKSNGQVMLINPAGIMFGQDSAVDVSGLVASTLKLKTFDTQTGHYEFEREGDAPDYRPSASKRGSLTVDKGSLLKIQEKGYAILLSEKLKHDGAIIAPKGKVILSGQSKASVKLKASDAVGFLVEGDPDSMVKISPDKVYLSLQGQSDLVSGVLNTDGNVDASGVVVNGDMISLTDGDIYISGSIEAESGHVSISAKEVQSISGASIDVSSESGQAGKISINADIHHGGGDLHADGAMPGKIDLQSGFLAQTGIITANGVVADGGEIRIVVSRLMTQSDSSAILASSLDGKGGQVLIQALQNGKTNNKIDSDFKSKLFLSGSINVSSVDETSTAGTITLLGDTAYLQAGILKANGLNGGNINIGGSFQGKGPLPNATLINLSTTAVIEAKATQGNGGNIIIWSDDETTFRGKIDASTQGTSKGGFVEISSKEKLNYSGEVNVSAVNGEAGTLMLDPKNIIIDNAANYPYLELLNPGILTVPAPSFGDGIEVFQNGNIIVGSPMDSTLGVLNEAHGAIYIYDGDTGALKKTFYGTTNNEQVGKASVSGVKRMVMLNDRKRMVLVNPKHFGGLGAFTVFDQDNLNGIPFGNKVGFNSLEGATNTDGLYIQAVPLTNLGKNHYMLIMPNLSNQALVKTGGVSFQKEGDIRVGLMIGGNTILGSQDGDLLGANPFDKNNPTYSKELKSGDYVLVSPYALGNKGAITIFSGQDHTWITSAADFENFSWVGSTAGASGAGGGDQVGAGGIIELNNGNILIRSPYFNNGANINAGALTVVQGVPSAPGTVGGVRGPVGPPAGAISVANSAVGSKANEYWGYPTNRDGFNMPNPNLPESIDLGSVNKVVTMSRNSSISGQANSGALVMMNATDGKITKSDAYGTITTANAVYGTHQDDATTFNVSFELTAFHQLRLEKLIGNNNYIWVMPNWDNRLAVSGSDQGGKGAVFFGKGNVTNLTAPVGAISALNSFVGFSNADFLFHTVGSSTWLLNNGNYFIGSKYLGFGGVVSAFGFVKWADGENGTTGVYTYGNNIDGNKAFSYVSTNSIPASNGNFIVGSLNSNHGAAVVSGTANTAGVLTANIPGITTNNKGTLTAFFDLKNGFALGSGSGISLGANGQVGAITKFSVTPGVSYVMDGTNSLYGKFPNDNFGNKGIYIYASGTNVSPDRALVFSSQLKNPATNVVGAGITYLDLNNMPVGTIDETNTLYFPGQIMSSSYSSPSESILFNGSNKTFVGGLRNNGDAIALVLDDKHGTVGQLQSYNYVPSTSAVLGIPGHSRFHTSLTPTGNVILVMDEMAPSKVFLLPPDISNLSYKFASNSDLTINPNLLLQSLNKGSNVVLQASNDISVLKDLVVTNFATPSGNLTLSAGRNVNISAKIQTNNSDVTIIANETTNVIPAQRQVGDGNITMLNPPTVSSIDVGTGKISLLNDNALGSVIISKLVAKDVVIIGKKNIDMPDASGSIEIANSLKIGAAGGGNLVNVKINGAPAAAADGGVAMTAFPSATGTITINSLKFSLPDFKIFVPPVAAPVAPVVPAAPPAPAAVVQQVIAQIVNNLPPAQAIVFVNLLPPAQAAIVLQQFINDLPPAQAELIIANIPQSQAASGLKLNLPTNTTFTLPSGLLDLALSTLYQANAGFLTSRPLAVDSNQVILSLSLVNTRLRNAQMFALNAGLITNVADLTLFTTETGLDTALDIQYANLMAVTKVLQAALFNNAALSGLLGDIQSLMSQIVTLNSNITAKANPALVAAINQQAASSLASLQQSQQTQAALDKTISQFAAGNLSGDTQAVADAKQALVDLKGLLTEVALLLTDTNFLLSAAITDANNARAALAQDPNNPLLAQIVSDADAVVSALTKQLAAENIVSGSANAVISAAEANLDAQNKLVSAETTLAGAIKQQTTLDVKAAASAAAAIKAQQTADLAAAKAAANPKDTILAQQALDAKAALATANEVARVDALNAKNQQNYVTQYQGYVDNLQAKADAAARALDVAMIELSQAKEGDAAAVLVTSNAIAQLAADRVNLANANVTATANAASAADAALASADATAKSAALDAAAAQAQSDAAALALANTPKSDPNYAVVAQAAADAQKASDAANALASSTADAAAKALNAASAADAAALKASAAASTAAAALATANYNAANAASNVLNAAANTASATADLAQDVLSQGTAFQQNAQAAVDNANKALAAATQNAADTAAAAAKALAASDAAAKAAAAKPNDAGLAAAAAIALNMSNQAAAAAANSQANLVAAQNTLLAADVKLAQVAADNVLAAANLASADKAALDAAAAAAKYEANLAATTNASAMDATKAVSTAMAAVSTTTAAAADANKATVAAIASADAAKVAANTANAAAETAIAALAAASPTDPNYATLKAAADTAIANASKLNIESANLAAAASAAIEIQQNADAAAALALQNAKSAVALASTLDKLAGASANDVLIANADALALAKDNVATAVANSTSAQVAADKAKAAAIVANTQAASSQATADALAQTAKLATAAAAANPQDQTLAKAAANAVAASNAAATIAAADAKAAVAAQALQQTANTLAVQAAKDASAALAAQNVVNTTTTQNAQTALQAAANLANQNAQVATATANAASAQIAVQQNAQQALATATNAANTAVAAADKAAVNALNANAALADAKAALASASPTDPNIVALQNAVATAQQTATLLNNQAAVAKVAADLAVAQQQSAINNLNTATANSATALGAEAAANQLLLNSAQSLANNNNNATTLANNALTTAVANNAAAKAADVSATAALTAATTQAQLSQNNATQLKAAADAAVAAAAAAPNDPKLAAAAIKAQTASDAAATTAALDLAALNTATQLKAAADALLAQTTLDAINAKTAQSQISLAAAQSAVEAGNLLNAIAVKNDAAANAATQVVTAAIAAEQMAVNNATQASIAVNSAQQTATTAIAAQQTAQQALQAATTALNNAKPTDANFATLQAAVQNAQVALDKTNASVASAQLTLVQAENNLQTANQLVNTLTAEVQAALTANAQTDKMAAQTAMEAALINSQAANTATATVQTLTANTNVLAQAATDAKNLVTMLSAAADKSAATAQALLAASNQATAAAAANPTNTALQSAAAAAKAASDLAAQTAAADAAAVVTANNASTAANAAMTQNAMDLKAANQALTSATTLANQSTAAALAAKATADASNQAALDAVNKLVNTESTLNTNAQTAAQTATKLADTAVATANQSAANLATAQQTLANAQAQLAAASPTDPNLAALQATVASAQAKVNALSLTAALDKAAATTAVNAQVVAVNQAAQAAVDLQNAIQQQAAVELFALQAAADIAQIQAVTAQKAALVAATNVANASANVVTTQQALATANAALQALQQIPNASPADVQAAQNAVTAASNAAKLAQNDLLAAQAAKSTADKTASTLTVAAVNAADALAVQTAQDVPLAIEKVAVIAQNQSIAQTNLQQAQTTLDAANTAVDAAKAALANAINSGASASTIATLKSQLAAATTAATTALDNQKNAANTLTMLNAELTLANQSLQDAQSTANNAANIAVNLNTQFQNNNNLGALQQTSSTLLAQATNSLATGNLSTAQSNAISAAKSALATAIASQNPQAIVAAQVQLALELNGAGAGTGAGAGAGIGVGTGVGTGTVTGTGVATNVLVGTLKPALDVLINQANTNLSGLNTVLAAAPGGAAADLQAKLTTDLNKLNTAIASGDLSAISAAQKALNADLSASNGLLTPTALAVASAQNAFNTAVNAANTNPVVQPLVQAAQALKSAMSAVTTLGGSGAGASGATTDQAKLVNAALNNLLQAQDAIVSNPSMNSLISAMDNLTLANSTGNQAAINLALGQLNAFKDQSQTNALIKNALDAFVQYQQATANLTSGPAQVIVQSYVNYIAAQKTVLTNNVAATIQQAQANYAQAQSSGDPLSLLYAYAGLGNAQAEVVAAQKNTDAATAFLNAFNKLLLAEEVNSSAQNQLVSKGGLGSAGTGVPGSAGASALASNKLASLANAAAINATGVGGGTQLTQAKLGAQSQNLAQAQGQLDSLLSQLNQKKAQILQLADSDPKLIALLQAYKNAKDSIKGINPNAKMTGATKDLDDLAKLLDSKLANQMSPNTSASVGLKATLKASEARYDPNAYKAFLGADALNQNYGAELAQRLQVMISGQCVKSGTTIFIRCGF